MTTYLLKSEPQVYSYDDLVREKKTLWTGVRNPTAQMNMRAMRRGDLAWYYHSQTDKAIVGLVTISKGPVPDPEQPGTTAKGDPKGVLVEVSPKVKLAKAIPLKQLKDDGRFKELDLIRQPRLSVMIVPDELDALLRNWAGL